MIQLPWSVQLKELNPTVWTAQTKSTEQEQLWWRVMLLAAVVKWLGILCVVPARVWIMCSLVACGGFWQQAILASNLIGYYKP